MSGHTRGRTWRARLERLGSRADSDHVAIRREATRLLREAGAFRRASGISSPRREWALREREVSWDDWAEAELVDLGRLDLWNEVDEIARQCRLDAREKAVLALCRLENRSLRDAARGLGVTVYQVRTALARALRKCQRHSRELPCTARALFWQEVRQKWASVYRRPYRRWKS
jgi:DNA-directed RNA polymerase specialized sigma24 family protein